MPENNNLKTQIMEVINDKPRKLYRSRNGKIGGVCSGLADYFNTDVVPVRLLAALGLLCGGLGFWVYLVCWIVIPLEPYDKERR